MKNVYVLPTNKPSRLVKIYNDVNRETFTLKLDVEVNDSFKEYVNIYITSDEEIKEGDWVIDEDYDEFLVYKADRIFFEIGKDAKKIILTTDQDLIKDRVQAVDDEFLEWFIKNPSCDYIEVKKEKIVLGEISGTTYTNFKYKIIIPKEELNYNVKQIKKNNLKNTQFEYELQAMIYGVLKENNNSSIELQSNKLVECVTDYFNHIECTFVIENGDKTNVKKGKLV